MIVEFLATRYRKKHDLSGFSAVEVFVVDTKEIEDRLTSLRELPEGRLVYLVVVDDGALTARGLMTQGEAREFLGEIALSVDQDDSLVMQFDDDAPLVSVVICSLFERVELLRSAVRSVLAQDYPNFELLLVDNSGSRDVSYPVVLGNELLQRVRIVREPTRGLSHARNTGAEASAGAFIAYLDDDEEVASNWLSTMVRHLEGAENCGAVTGPVLPRSIETVAQLAYVLFQPDEMGSTLEGGKFFHAELLEKGLTRYGVGYLGGSGNLVVRKSAFDAIGGFDPRISTPPLLTSGEDLDFFLRLLDSGQGILKTTDAPIYHELRVSEEAYLHQSMSFGRAATALVAADLLRSGLRSRNIFGGTRAFGRKLIGRFFKKAQTPTSARQIDENIALAKSLNHYASIAEAVGMFGGPLRYVMTVFLHRPTVRMGVTERGH